MKQPNILIKRLLPLMLACAVLCSLFALPTAAKSGDKTVSSPTPSEIAARYASIRPATSVYKTKPSFTAPYAAGALSDSMLDNAEDYLNYIRYLAGLPAVSMTDALNDEAQHGAVLLAATDQFTHYPQKPADMSQAFFDKGYSATSSSNLSGSFAGSGGFWTDATEALAEGIQGCMNDASSYDNFTSVGHRRWFLNPSLKYIGFGFAEYGNERIAAMKIFDRSGGEVDYDYVSWPPQGYCPSNLFHVTVPWSVSLNPDVYDWIDRDALKVTVRNLTTGERWVVDSSTPIDKIGEAYLHIADAMYGEGECIIFQPGYYVDDDGMVPYAERTGEYSVTITGLAYTNGSPATLQYTTNFFDLEHSMELAITKQPTDATAAFGETVKTSVVASGAGLRYQWYVKEPGTTKWIKSSVKTNTYSYVMTKAKSGRQVYCVITDSFGESVTTDTVTLKVRTPYISKQPTDAVAKVGSIVKTSVTAVGKGLTYRWYVKNPGSSSFIKSKITASTYQYSMTPDKSGRQVYCIITDEKGDTVRSDTVTLRMPLPKFTKQPTDVVVKAGEIASVAVAAEGDGLTYQWYFKNPGMGTFAKSSVTTPTYSYVMTKAKSGRQVYCKITDQYGQTAKSDKATLSMPKPIITKQPTNAKAAVGKTATVSVAATGDGLRYQWYYKNPGATKFLKSSVKTSTYSYVMTKAKAGRQVYCVIADQYGQTVKSDTVTMTVPKLTVTKQPTGASAAIGQTVKTSVTAKGDGLRYQWYFKNADMKTFAKSSVKTSSYSYVMTAAKAGRQVYCVITDQYGNTVKTATVTFKRK